MRIAFFSTCHEKGFEKFGREYIESFFDYMPNNVDFHVFSENWETDFTHDKLFIHDIEEVKKWRDFKLTHLDKIGLVEKEDGKQAYNYRLNAIGFSAKIFPLEILAKRDYDWIISLDCDVKFKKPLSKEVLEDHLPKGATAVYLGRKDYAHSETGFVAYNMNRNASRMISRMVKMYESGEVFNLEGWTDSYVFDYVKEFLEGIKTDYYRFHNISEGVEGLHVWPKTWLSEYMDHLKGPAAKEGVEWLNEFPSTLIGQAVHTVTQFKPRTIIDIGVFDGTRAVAFAKASLWAQSKKSPEGVEDAVHLWACDTSGEQQSVALDNFHKLQRENPRFTFTYIDLKTDSDKFNPEAQLEHPTLGRIELGKADFAYVDGGHSEEELRRDLLYMCPEVKMVMTPTYFLPDKNGNSPDTRFVGCNEIMEATPHKVLPAMQEIEGGGIARACVFGPAVTPGHGKVRTRNAVPDEIIQRNIGYSTGFDVDYRAMAEKALDDQIKELQEKKEDLGDRRQIPFVKQCEIHDTTALIIAGGPSVVDSTHPDHDKNWDTIKKCMDRNNVRTFTVKTSHDHMIYDLGIIPNGCFLLDPRAHVVDFIDNPHEDVTYFCSSMCDASTWDKLIEKAPKLFGYNAAVKAGEIGFLHKTLGHKKAVFFGGGSSSATRAIGILHGMGFRKFLFAGFDQCWWDTAKIDLDETDTHGRKKYITVTLDEQKFITQPILLAAMQDVEQSIREHPDLEVSAITYGMCSVVLDKIKKPHSDFFKEYDV
jgi:hypothetical protein